MQLLENDLVKLRALEEKDIEVLYQWENDTINWPVSNMIQPLSEGVLKEYMETAHYDIFATRQLRLVILDKVADLAVGFLDLFEFDPMNMRAGIGVLIGLDGSRGKGLASAALSLIEEYAFKHLRLNQLHAQIDETNEDSIKLFEKAGFLNTSSFHDWKNIEGNWVDVLLYQKFNR